jgi:hypothetical protein
MSFFIYKGNKNWAFAYILVGGLIMNNTNVINYNSILEGSGLGDIAHLIHGGFMVLVAVWVVIMLAVVVYKVWKGDI